MKMKKGSGRPSAAAAKSDAEKQKREKAESVEELREELLDGGFGHESSAFEGGGDAADDSVVEEFISMFGAEGKTPLKAADWKAYVPSEIVNDPDFQGRLYGFVREETESIYVLTAPQFQDREHWIGFLAHEAKYGIPFMPWDDRVNVLGYCDHGELRMEAWYTGQRLTGENGGTDDPLKPIAPYEKVRIKTYDQVTDLFSRNTGLLESSEMLDKRVVLAGCGSVGSFVGMELARSGVGSFVLIDTDTLEIHNICRHQCGFDDLGRYKVDAVKDKILNINPDAEVVTFRSEIQQVPESELMPLLGRDTLIFGAGDNRASSDYCCRLAARTDSSFVTSCCWSRAFAGEVFYWQSGHDLSCYSCALGGLIDDERPDSHDNYFGSEEEMESLSFEPGIAADIDFVTLIAVKLSLDLLNRDNENYTPRVIDYLKQYTWVCNTNSEKIGGARAGIFPNPLFITNNLKVNRDPNCPYCGDHR